ncbi:MAG: thioredoxin family protein [Chloroflexota bacterium]
MSEEQPFFDEETEKNLPALLEHLPEPVKLVVWGDPEATEFEKQAVRLCEELSSRFKTISYTTRPRRVNYDYYPVIGVMGGDAEDTGDHSWEDFGVRVIGLPAGYSMTSFITAVQAVSFRGMTLDAMTRIKLKQLTDKVNIQVISAANNEGGAIVAQPAFNMAVVSANIRTLYIMSDQFPAITTKYSIDIVPHMVINGRVHISGVIDEGDMLKQVAQAVKTAPI